MAKPPLGTGERFAALKTELSHKKGVENPGRLAAWIGRKNLGDQKMQELAAAGRSRKAAARHRSAT